MSNSTLFSFISWTGNFLYNTPPTSYMVFVIRILGDFLLDRFVLILLSFFLGMAVVIISELLLFWKHFQQSPVSPPPKFTNTRVHLPKVLKDRLDKPDVHLKQKEKCVWFNFLAQFLFSELRDSLFVRRFLTRKIQTEFEEVLRSRSGVLVDELFLRDFHLGDNFPVILEMSVENSQVSHDIVQTIDLKALVVYDGGFQIAIDAALPFKRMAFVSVKVLKLKGLMRFRFTLLPFSHWSMSFYDEPELELDVTAQLDGRPMPKLKNIIANQIRRIVRRKHTLPMYKMRYKPFFQPRADPSREVPQTVKIDGKEIGKGMLEVTVIEASRLPFVAKGAKMYCTLSVDELPWRQLIAEEKRKKKIITVELVRNSTDQSLGMTVKDDLIRDRLHSVVVIEVVSVGSPAHMANVQEGDILVGVSGNKVLTAKQAMKNLKWAKDNRIQLQLERASTDTGVATATKDDLGLPRRVNSWHNAKDKSTHPHDTDSITSLDTISLPRTSAPVGSMNMGGKDFLHHTSTDVRKTKLKNASENPKWGDQKFIFTVKPKIRYLNICVWSQGGDRSGRPEIISNTKQDILVGYVSLNLDDIYLHCLLTLNGTMYDRVSLRHGHYKTDPESVKNWSIHKGWDPNQMYGDISLNFHFVPAHLNQGQRHAMASCKAGTSKVQEHVTQRFGTNAAVQAKPTTVPKLAQDIKRDLNEGHHQFDSTTFVTATFCDYCGKKIWMKDAFKCRTCNMVCHKKCLVKCLVNTFCTESGVKKRDALDEAWEPLTSGKARQSVVSDGSDSRNVADSEDLPGDLETVDEESAQEKEFLRSLSTTPDGSHGDKDSLRKRAESNPEINPMNRFRSLKEQTEKMKDNVMKHLKRNKVQTALSDKAIMSAKEVGAQLFADLEPAQRKDKLEELVKNLDEQLMAEMENKEAIEQEISLLQAVEVQAINPKKKSELRSLQNKASKSAEKQDAMRLLMLQYCSGLQNCLKSLEAEAGSSVAVTRTDSPGRTDQPGRTDSPGRTESPGPPKEIEVKTDSPKLSRSAVVGGFMRRASSSVKERVSSIKKDFGRKGHKTAEEKPAEGEPGVSVTKSTSHDTKVLKTIEEGSQVQMSDLELRRETRSKSEGHVEDLISSDQFETLKEVLGAGGRSSEISDVPLSISHPPIEIRVDDVDKEVMGASGGAEDEEGDMNEPYKLSREETGMCRSRSDSGLEISKMLSLSPEDILRYRGSSLPRLLASDDSDSDSDFLMIDSSDEPVVTDSSDSEPEVEGVMFEGGKRRLEHDDSDDGTDQHRGTDQQQHTFQV